MYTCVNLKVERSVNFFSAVIRFSASPYAPIDSPISFRGGAAGQEFPELARANRLYHGSGFFADRSGGARRNYGAGSAGGSPEMQGTGGALLVEQVKAAGTKFIFSNPGSYEVGFFDALVDRPDLILIEGLHEGVVVSMAGTGYSRVLQKPAFVNVHAIAGTAQMGGQLYNAHRDGTPLIVTAGMADITTFNDDVALGPVPGFHQTDINRQFTKMSWETLDPNAIPLHAQPGLQDRHDGPRRSCDLSVSSNALEATKCIRRSRPADSFLMSVRPRACRRSSGHARQNAVGVTKTRCHVW